jgi:8-oxo-dGTP pyrophosphatase MutT (NUDIX family)
VLTGWAAPDDEQERLRSAYVAHLHGHDDGLLKSCVPAHLTASAMVLDHTGERVLLTLHRKGGFWGQLGGHCEPGDSSLAGAALREATEESGMAGLRLFGDAPVDLDRHALSSAFGRCGEHLDVRYAVVAPAGAEPVVSDESDDLAWFAADALPSAAVADLSRLVARARAALRWDQASKGNAPSDAASSAGSSSDSPRSAVADTPSR